MSNHDELIGLTACEAVDRLKRRDVTPIELLDAALARIEQVNPAVNAVPTLCTERARSRARQIMEMEDPGGRGWLAGLPVLIKDTVDVAGVRTTYGSPIFKDHVPEKSAIQVERLEAHGAVVLGKTNTPEFAAGANTFNEVFGATLNPWNEALTCGGSSGGAAVSLATGMTSLANGSDLGGSLRTPASFCSVIGLRPSPGCVAQGPGPSPFQTLSVEGPMARNVRDTALMLDAMAGQDNRDPLSYPAPAQSYMDALAEPITLGKIAFSADLGGVTPVDVEIAKICGKAAARIGELGTTVIEDRCPDLSQSVDIFTILRAEAFVAGREPMLEKYREVLKPEIIWNIEAGRALDASQIGWANRERGLIAGRMAAFFEDHDLLLCPAAIVPPFDVNIRYLERLGEHTFPSYIDWVSITYALTLTGCPVLSLPCGFTSTGLPVGMQIVAPPKGEAKLLRAALVLEELFGIKDRVPMDPRSLGSVD